MLVHVTAIVRHQHLIGIGVHRGSIHSDRVIFHFARSRGRSTAESRCGGAAAHANAEIFGARHRAGGRRQVERVVCSARDRLHGKRLVCIQHIAVTIPVHPHTHAGGSEGSGIEKHTHRHGRGGSYGESGNRQILVIAGGQIVRGSVSARRIGGFRVRGIRADVKSRALQVAGRGESLIITEVHRQSLRHHQNGNSHPDESGWRHRSLMA